VSQVIALCGGVGGAKLAHGLSRVLAEDQLTIVVNTGDDFEHLGLYVSPDVDTVAYTLSGLADRERGWGVAGETWQFMASLSRLGGEDWFLLGDQDLAMHVERTRRLAAGQTLSQITVDLTRAMGIKHPIVPMSDEPVRTIIKTRDGELTFQRYFVGERCRPVAKAIRFDGAQAARPSPRFRAVLEQGDISAIVICPSNPYLSVDPILAVPGVRKALEATGAPIVAVSPIIGGEAVKGPAAKLMRELGVTPGVVAVADHYEGLLDGLVIDAVDAHAADRLREMDVETLATNAIMSSDDDRSRLARDTLALAERLTRRRTTC